MFNQFNPPFPTSFMEVDDSSPYAYQINADPAYNAMHLTAYAYPSKSKPPENGTDSFIRNSMDSLAMEIEANQTEYMKEVTARLKEPRLLKPVDRTDDLFSKTDDVAQPKSSAGSTKSLSLGALKRPQKSSRPRSITHDNTYKEKFDDPFDFVEAAEAEQNREEEEEAFKCEGCGVIAENEQKFRKHQSLCCAVWECKDCGAKFRTKGTLAIHARLHNTASKRPKFGGRVRGTPNKSTVAARKATSAAGKQTAVSFVTRQLPGRRAQFSDPRLVPSLSCKRPEGRRKVVPTAKALEFAELATSFVDGSAPAAFASASSRKQLPRTSPAKGLGKSRFQRILPKPASQRAEAPDPPPVSTRTQGPSTRASLRGASVMRVPPPRAIQILVPVSSSSQSSSSASISTLSSGIRFLIPVSSSSQTEPQTVVISASSSGQNSAAQQLPERSNLSEGGDVSLGYNGAGEITSGEPGVNRVTEQQGSSRMLDDFVLDDDVSMELQPTSSTNHRAATPVKRASSKRRPYSPETPWAVWPTSSSPPKAAKVRRVGPFGKKKKKPKQPPASANTKKKWQVQIADINASRFKPRSFECSKCGDEFANRKALWKHTDRYHKKKPKPKPATFDCVPCGYRFLTKQALAHHVENNCVSRGQPARKPRGPNRRRDLTDSTCDRCHYIFSSPEALVYHREKQGCTPRELKCILCNLVLASELLLEQHMRAHAPFACPVCSLIVNSAKLLLEHKKEHPPEEMAAAEQAACGSGSKAVAQKKEKRCEFCDKLFRTNGGVDAHVRKHHHHLPCGFCSMVFTLPEDLAAHRKEQHEQRKRARKGASNDSDVDFGAAELSRISSESFLTSQALVCKFCQQSFPDKAHLQKHTSIMHPGDFKCAVCPFESMAKTELIEHLLVEHAGFNRSHPQLLPHICNFCDSGFLTPQAYETHLKRHSGLPEKRVICKLCNAPFASKAQGSIHYRIVHTFNDAADKLYKCSHCLLSFGFAAGLIAHLSHHAEALAKRDGSGGQRGVARFMPFECGVCGKGFRWRTELIKHAKERVKSHSGKASIQCTKCGEFLTTDGLMKHNLKHWFL